MEWRVCEDFPRYEVNARGEVRNRRTGRLLAQYHCYKGYCQVSLMGKKRNHAIRVHLLVARAFLGPRPGVWLVDHIDHDKANPKLENLRYISPSENTKRAIAEGRFSPRPPKRFANNGATNGQ